MATHIQADQVQSPSLSPKLPYCTDANNHPHKQQEYKIGERSEADQICARICNELLGFCYSNCGLTAKLPPPCKLTYHNYAHTSPDQAGNEEDQTNCYRYISHAVLYV